MRYWFGGQPSDYVVAPGEQVLLTDESIGYQTLLVPGVTLWVYDYETGQRLIDLLDSTGSPVENLRTSDYGLIPRFRGPDEVRRVLIGPASQPNGEEEQSSPGRWVLTSTDWPAIIAHVETRVAVLEDTPGGGEEGPEPVATAHPMIWSQARVQARTSSHRYVNLEGRTQTVTVVRAEATVATGQVDVHLLTVDMVTGTATVGAAVSLTPRGAHEHDLPFPSSVGERGNRGDRGCGGQRGLRGRGADGAGDDPLILLDNTLTGAPGTGVSGTTLADSAKAGTVTVRSTGPRAVYDDTYSVHGQGGIRLESGYHRRDTPALEVALPPTPWALRWYMRSTSLQSAGFGTNEVRWAVGSGGPGLVFRESASGLAQVRTQPRDLAAELLPHEYTGPGIRLAQVLRVELRQDNNRLTARVFAGHDEQIQDTWTFSGFRLSGTLSLTGYRYRARPTLYWGDQGSAVRELQLDLIDLGYDLGQWKADGDFGNATYEALRLFQRARGVTPVDGIPGPKTRAGIDLALGRVPSPLWISHLTLSDGPWVGPAVPELPPLPSPDLVLGFPI